MGRRETIVVLRSRVESAPEAEAAVGAAPYADGMARKRSRTRRVSSRGAPKERIVPDSAGLYGSW